MAGLEPIEILKMLEEKIHRPIKMLYSELIGSGKIDFVLDPILHQGKFGGRRYCSFIYHGEDSPLQGSLKGSSREFSGKEIIETESLP